MYSNRQILERCGIVAEELDYQSARMVADLYPGIKDLAYLLTLLLLLRQKNGAIALPISDTSGTCDFMEDAFKALFPEMNTSAFNHAFDAYRQVSIDEVISSGLIKKVEDTTRSYNDAVVLLDHSRLYLRRFWRYENDVATMVLSRSASIEDSVTSGQDNVTSGRGSDSSIRDRDTPGQDNVSSIQDNVTSGGPSASHPAVQAGLAYRFAVITGGPGTGKTHSVVQLLGALLTEQPDLRIVLCAPTGKAAARMMESIQQNLASIPLEDAVRSLIPESASTIHRLIRWNPALGRSVYDATNPLPYDVVILDEASMVDIALMSRLARALRPETRLILLGDRDQLSSVEAGAVFADIASRSAPNVVRLTTSWRFGQDSEIGQLARLINSGDAEESWEFLMKGTDVTVLAQKEILYNHVADRVRQLHQSLLKEEDHVAVFALLQRTQILTALRVGSTGADILNTEMDRIVGGGLDWYEGRPVMATANNYDIEIYNGDVGVTRNIEGRLMVAFPGHEKGKIRWVAPAQLKSVASAWALTVHKSQGSEYDDVLFILPDRMAPVLTRELAYTALTRARKTFTVWGSKDIWKKMVLERVKRQSGLADRLQ